MFALSPIHRFLPLPFVLATLFVSSPPAASQWSPDPATNLRICDVTGEQVIPKIVATGDGGAYVSWFDSRGGSYAVYLQRVDSLGVPQWGSDGLLISSHPQNTWLVDYDMDVDQENNAVIVFCDIRNGGDFNPFAYKISPQGSFLWGANGITLSDSTGVFQAAPRVRVTTDGSATVVWSFLSSPNKVAMQRISADGAKLWGEQPLLLSGTGPEHLTYPSLVASDSGSVILLWSGYSGSFLNPQNYRLYTQKFSPQAAPLWGSTPDTVYNLGRVPGFYVPTIVPDGSGGALYGWHDDRNMTNLSTSYVQHFTATGSPLFPPNGSAVSTFAGNNHFDVSVAYGAASGETFAAWTETNALQTQTGMYGQKFSATGSRLWGESGLVLVPLSANSLAYVTVAVRDTFTLIWWNDLFSGGVNNALRGMKLNAQGTRLWGDSTRTVCSAPGEKIDLATAMDYRGISMLAWSDRRSDNGGIYAQSIQLDGTLGNPLVSVREQHAPAAGFALRQCYPNPFNPTTTITFSISGAAKAGDVSLRVFDLLGRATASLVNGHREPGEHRVVFDASGLPGGVYFYTLKAGSFRETRRMLLLK